MRYYSYETHIIYLYVFIIIYVQFRYCMLALTRSLLNSMSYYFEGWLVVVDCGGGVWLIDCTRNLTNDWQVVPTAGVTRLGMEAKKEENLPDWYSQVEM